MLPLLMCKTFIRMLIQNFDSLLLLLQGKPTNLSCSMKVLSLHLFRLNFTHFKQNNHTFARCAEKRGQSNDVHLNQAAEYPAVRQKHPTNRRNCTQGTKISYHTIVLASSFDFTNGEKTQTHKHTRTAYNARDIKRV